MPGIRPGKITRTKRVTRSESSVLDYLDGLGALGFYSDAYHWDASLGANGTLVDQSASDNSPIAPFPPNTPTYVAASGGDPSLLRFDGVSNYLQLTKTLTLCGITAPITLPLATCITMRCKVIGSGSSGSQYAGVFAFDDNANATDFQVDVGSTTECFYKVRQTGLNFTSSTDTTDRTGDWVNLTICIDPVNGSFDHLVNGVGVYSVAISDATPYPFSVDEFYIAANRSGAQRAELDFVAASVYFGQPGMTGQQLGTLIGAVERFFNSKYGLPD